MSACNNYIFMEITPKINKVIRLDVYVFLLIWYFTESKCLYQQMFILTKIFVITKCLF